jgi:hypothetical protein
MKSRSSKREMVLSGEKARGMSKVTYLRASLLAPQVLRLVEGLSKIKTQNLASMIFNSYSVEMHPKEL